MQSLRKSACKACQTNVFSVGWTADKKKSNEGDKPPDTKTILSVPPKGKTEKKASGAKRKKEKKSDED